MNHFVKILEKEWLTPDVMRFKLEKPSHYSYEIGQAISITIDFPQYVKSFIPLTLTSIKSDDYLEVIVKVYSERMRFTYIMSKLEVGQRMIVSDAWDSYSYVGEGVFIAAGSGITPFIPMIKSLKQRNSLANHLLIYANKTKSDIIAEDELKTLLNEKFLNILSQEQNEMYEYGRINKSYLAKNIPDFSFSQFYICGPEQFTSSVKVMLTELGVTAHKIQVGY